MRNLAAAATATAALAFVLVLPAAGAGPQPVLGMTRDGPSAGRLAWFDPVTLAALPGRKVALDRYSFPWAFSADRSVLALAGSGDARIRFVNARAMRRLGDLSLSHAVDVQVVGLAWARDDRLLAAVRQTGGGFIAVIDAQRRRVIRRVAFPSIRLAKPIRGGLALLLGPPSGFGPARLALVNADGVVRKVALDRIRVGEIDTQTEKDYRIELSQPGLDVDPAAGRAFVVGADFTIATVDLDTLSLAYHAPSSRALAKTVTGTTRTAAWLGNGVLAVAGADFEGTDKSRPVGLRLVDTRDWSFRTVDPTVAWFDLAGRLLLAGNKVFDENGALRYSVDLAADEWLDVAGPYLYVCDARAGRLRRLLTLATGATIRSAEGASGPFCPTLLYGQSSA